MGLLASPSLPDRHGGDPAGVGDGAAPGDPVQDAGLANFLLIHEYALLLEKRIKFFSTLTKSTFEVPCSSAS